jgi:hypothetical protein
MSAPTLPAPGDALARDLANGIGGEIVVSKSGIRIVAGGRTLCWVNQRRHGVQLDFRAADVAEAAAKARKTLDVRGARARLNLNGNPAAVTAARILLEHVTQKAGAV